MVEKKEKAKIRLKFYKVVFSITEAATDLETIEICIEDASTLDVRCQPHCQLFIGLISDVNHGADLHR